MLIVMYRLFKESVWCLRWVMMLFYLMLRCNFWRKNQGKNGICFVRGMFCLRVLIKRVLVGQGIFGWPRRVTGRISRRLCSSSERISLLCRSPVAGRRSLCQWSYIARNMKSPPKSCQTGPIPGAISSRVKISTLCWPKQALVKVSNSSPWVFSWSNW